jgi:hypothetical protein
VTGIALDDLQGLHVNSDPVTRGEGRLGSRSSPVAGPLEMKQRWPSTTIRCGAMARNLI